MSYTEHTWQTGETITAAKLNNLEEGIQEAAQSGGGGILVHGSMVNNVYTLDMTVEDLYDATLAGTPVYLVNQYRSSSDDYFGTSLCYLFSVFKYSSDKFRVAFITHMGWGAFYNRVGMPVFGIWWFEASTLDAYPTSVGSASIFDIINL